MAKEQDNQMQDGTADRDSRASAGYPSGWALEKSAQLWGQPNTSNIVMIPELAQEIAKLLDQYREALMWCSGSIDFAPEGKARQGWLKIVQPLLD